MIRFVNRLAIAAAAASIVVSLAPLAATHWWIFDLFSNFRLQYLLGQIVIALALLLLHRPRWFVALLPFMVLNAVALAPYVNSAGRGDVAGTDLTLMTVNLSARNESLSALVDIIEHENPDILLLVEFTGRWADDLRALDARYPHRFKIPRAGVFGIALLSRYPLQSSRALELGRTVAIDVRIAAPADAFRLLGVHLVPPVSAQTWRERNEQLDELARLGASSDEPIVVIGDFNVSPSSPFLADFQSRTGLRHSLLGRGPGFSWPSFAPVFGIAIDHCFVSEEFTVTAHRRLADFGSDHYPILVGVAQEPAT